MRITSSGLGLVRGVGGNLSAVKFSDAPEDTRRQNVEYVSDRWKELAALQRDAAGHATNYLMVTNAGGAVAVLSFMGAMKTARPFDLAVPMLTFFILGVVIVGAGRALAFFHVARRFDRWRDAAHRYYNDEWTWAQALDHDSAMGTRSRLGAFLGFSSFGCFLAGCALGVVSLA